MEVKSIRKLRDLKSKTVFLRSDFNVPIKNGKILDDYKIVAGMSTIRYLLRHGCRVIIATHLGEPDGKKEKGFSTLPIANALMKLLGEKVGFVEDCIGEKAEKAAANMKRGSVLLLENLRFHKEETKNDKAFAKKLADLADIYVNNAFAVCHREHASVSAITKYLPAYAGLLVEKEVASLDKLLHPEKPLIVLMGGAKISTKLPLLEKLSYVADHCLLGGALANTFLYMLGFEVGKSVVEKDYYLMKQLKKFYKVSGDKKILLPIDVVVSQKKDGMGKVSVKNVHNVGKGDFIYDIGPKTIHFYAKFIKKARTIAWNGPMGFFELKHFKHGTLAVAHTMAARSTGTAFGVAGGGETIEALKLTQMMEYVDWVSTGGGAMLSYLGGEKMPGLKPIIK